MKSIEELDVSHDLEQQGVSGISIEGNTIVVIHNQVPIRFDIIQASWFKTIKGFQSVAKDFITDKKLIQAIIVDLNKNYSTIIGMRNTQTTNERRSDHNYCAH